MVYTALYQQWKLWIKLLNVIVHNITITITYIEIAKWVMNLQH